MERQNPFDICCLGAVEGIPIIQDLTPGPSPERRGEISIINLAPFYGSHPRSIINSILTRSLFLHPKYHWYS